MRDVVNLNSGLEKVRLISDASVMLGQEKALLYVEETSTLYEYTADGPDSANGTSLLDTLYGSARHDRWVAIAGRYTYYGSGGPALLAAGSTSTGAICYNGLTRNPGMMYGGTNQPSTTDLALRLNFDGWFWASQLVSCYDANIHDMWIGMGGGNSYTNTRVGNNCFMANGTGVDNTAVGTNAGRSITSGARNTALGRLALDALTTTNDNTCIGYNTFATSASGTSNVFIGSGSGTQAGQLIGVNGSIAIGAYSYTTKNNQLVLGASSIVETLLRGKVGISRLDPTAYLHLPAGTAAAGTAPIKLATGVALSATEDGVFEYHGSHLYFTIGSTRYQLDQQSGSASALINIETLSANKTLTAGTDKVIQALSPNGLDRTINLVHTGATEGHRFKLINNAAYNSPNFLIIQLNGVEATRLGCRTAAEYVYSGTAWIPQDVNAGSTDVDNKTAVACGPEALADAVNATAYGYHAYAVNTGAVALGAQSLASGLAAPIAIGYSANAGGTSGIAIGPATAASGSYSIAIGDNASTFSRSFAIAKGYYSRAENLGDEVVNISAQTAYPNIAKYVDNGWYGVTTDSNLTELFLQGTTSRYTIPASSAVAFRILVTAINGSSYDTKAWEITGLIKRNNANTTTLVGVSPSIIANDAGAAAWAVSVDADDINDALRIRVQGQVAANIRWAAKLETTEVKF